MSKSDPTFTNSSAVKEWQRYFSEVDRLLRPLNPERREEIRDELVSHVLDGMDANGDDDEASRLRTVLNRLGPPGIYLDRVAGDLVAAGEHSVFWKMRRTLATLGRNAALVSSYLLGLMALCLALAKPFFPENVGLYRMPSGWYMAGYIDVNEATELIGYWIIPVMLLLAWFLWITPLEDVFWMMDTAFFRLSRASGSELLSTASLTSFTAFFTLVL